LRSLFAGERALQYDTTLQEACRWAIDTKGKRLRLRLFVQAAQVDGRAEPGLLASAATAVELLHLASLVHDDVVDESDTRRGKPSVRSKFGDHAAVLGGCWLAAQAIQLVAATGDAPTRMFADTARRMCDGQILELDDVGRVDRSVARYLRSIEGKTGSLFSLSSALAAELSGAAADDVQALERYGRHLGVAFQIVDDTLDVAGDPGAIGKDVGTDLQRGLYTLPVLYARDAEPAIREALSVDGAHNGGRASLLLDVCRAGGVESALATADEHLDHARRAIAHLGGTRELEMFTESLMEYGRTSLAGDWGWGAREAESVRPVLETAGPVVDGWRAGGRGPSTLAPAAGLPDGVREGAAAVLAEAARALETDFTPLREVLAASIGSPASGLCAATVMSLVAEGECAFRDRAFSAAVALELVATLPRLTAGIAKTASENPLGPNENALRTLAIDLVQSRAVIAAAEVGASFTRQLGAAVASWSETQMLHFEIAEGRRGARSVDADPGAHLGGFAELAARMAPQLSLFPADETRHYARFGRELGIAAQLATDCVELLTSDRPGARLSRISAPAADVVSHARRSAEALEHTSRRDRRLLTELTEVPVRILHRAFSAPAPAGPDRP
jgi:heptaprenyl diphosphate synthase